MSDNEKTLEVLSDLANGLEAVAVRLKNDLAQLATEGSTEKPKNAVTVPEQVFNVLKYEAAKGEKLGDFETADKKSNVEQNWTHAFNILKQNNATINTRFHGSGYAYSYWLYNDRIFRKKFKQVS